MLAHDTLGFGQCAAAPLRTPSESTPPANDAAYRLRLVPAGDPLRPNTKPLARPHVPVLPSAPILYEEFHPYGTSAYRAVDSTIGVSAKRYRYTGKERDEETGLDHMGARYYAGWLGRWTAADPIGLGDGVNRYAYVRGNPVGLRDPSGTESLHGDLVTRQNELIAAAANATPESRDAILAEIETVGEEIAAEMEALRHDYAVDDEVPEQGPTYNEDVNYESEPAPRFAASGTGKGPGRAPNTDAEGNLLPVAAAEDPYAGARELARHPEALVPVVGPAIDSARSFAAISSKNSWDENVALAGLGVANAAFTVIDFVSLGLASPGTQAVRTGTQLVVRAEARNVGRAEVTRALDPVVEVGTKVHGHHSDPKFMGGEPRQPLTDLPSGTHSELHNDLNAFLRQRTDEFGNHMRPQRGNPGAAIRENFSRQERLEALRDFYREFGEKYPDAARDFFQQHPGLK